ncbi:MAG: VWA domain-containing protein [Chloroflexi bacterium]|nr:MAG: VWA domain-containing protein [Chloroflexota bacterium]
MKIRYFLPLTLGILFLLLALPQEARADGIIIPDPPVCFPGPCPPPPCPDPVCPPVPPMQQLVVRYHKVDIMIEDQVAVTHVDQVFYNPNDWTIEGTYIFPIPVDAAVSAFTLWVDGKPVKGQVLDAEEARRTYEEIVRSLRDPALLEYAGQGAVKARIFPIPSKGEQRIELEYTQALTADNGLVKYVYPLSTEKFSALPLEEVSVSVDIRSGSPIRAVYSPSHNVSIERVDDHHVRVGYEESNVKPDADFSLYYSVGESEAFHLLSYRDPSDEVDPGGFFLLLLAPRPEAEEETLPKDVILVLDRSGSMDGEKFLQAQDALRYILERLNPEDRFNIITFSTGIEMYADELRPADEAKEALPWVDRLSASGSTDINRALLEATAMTTEARIRERPAYLIFLTDGLPTEGEIEPARILENFEYAAPQGLRLFAFGVGYDVDTYLLDTLAMNQHGTSFYVQPGERLDEALSSFYFKISTPVLTDLSLDFGDQTVFDVYPSPLPDLFVGSQIVVVGRYREAGAADATLSGYIQGQEKIFRFTDLLFESDSRGGSPAEAALPRLWATRKIGALLNRVRLDGPDQETIDQIVMLSIRYGIVTPYTSYLVTEEMPLGAAEQERIAGEQLADMKSMASAPTFGQEAVQRASEQGAMAGADAVSGLSEEAASVVKIVGSHTFVLTDGVWVDTSFDPEKMKTVHVPFLSKEYFTLATTRPELGDAFALGDRVIALSEGKAYEVVEAIQDEDPKMDQVKKFERRDGLQARRR